VFLSSLDASALNDDCVNASNYSHRWHELSFQKDDLLCNPAVVFFLFFLRRGACARVFFFGKSRSRLIIWLHTWKRDLIVRRQAADPPSMLRQHARQARRFAKTFAVVHSIRLSLNRIGNNAVFLKIITNIDADYCISQLLDVNY